MNSITTCLGALGEYFRPAVFQPKKKVENNTFEVLSVKSQFSVDSLSAHSYRRGGVMVFVAHHEVSEAMSLPKEEVFSDVDLTAPGLSKRDCNAFKEPEDGQGDGSSVIAMGKTVQNRNIIENDGGCQDFRDAKLNTIDWVTSVRSPSNTSVDTAYNTSTENISATSDDAGEDDFRFQRSRVFMGDMHTPTNSTYSLPDPVYARHVYPPYRQFDNFPSPLIRKSRQAQDWTGICEDEFILPKIHRSDRPFLSSPHIHRKTVELEQAILEMNEDLRKSHRKAQCVDRLLSYEPQDKGLGISI